MNRLLYILRAFAATIPLFAYSDTIILSDGKTVHGELAGTIGGYLSIIVEDSSNHAELRYRVELVERIEFSDSIDRQDTIDGFSKRHPIQSTALLEELALKRLPYLEILGSEDEPIFTLLLESYILSGRKRMPLRGEAWLQKLLRRGEASPTRTPDCRRLETKPRESVTTEDSGSMQAIPPKDRFAMGFVSQHRPCRRGSRNALVTLNPIVFSTPSRPSFLEDAYAIAIISAFKLGDETQAHQLKTAMQKRRFTLPANSRWPVLVAEAESQSQDGSATDQRAFQNVWKTDPVYKLAGKP